MTKEWIDYPPRSAKHLQELAERGSDSYFRKVLKENAQSEAVAVDNYDKKLASAVRKGKRFQT
jgi:hypothetical protein